MIERLAAIISDLTTAALTALLGSRPEPKLVPVRVRRDDRR